MTQEQWEKLLAFIRGDRDLTPMAGFIIDSPWLPHWYGISTLDYFTDGYTWFNANLKAVSTFSDAIFFPGFWAEFGMCSEPASFGSRCSFYEYELPFAHPVTQVLENIICPNCQTDGLTPFILKRLEQFRASIEAAGHHIRFAVSRGPLTIASFLMGTTEFLMALRMEPEKVHRLLDAITKFISEWLCLQRTRIETVDGIMILDDIVGFLAELDFLEFAKPYLGRIFSAFDASIRFFHNDASGLVCASHLVDLKVNMFNFSHEHSLAQIQQLTGGQIILMGNLPPRDVLANGRPEQIRQSVHDMVSSCTDTSNIIFSCGGGMPPYVSTENINAFLMAVKEFRYNSF